jgi:cell division protein FtsI (penicillin-binding protein 3)
MSARHPRRPHAARRGVLLACFCLAGALVVGRAFQLQALEGEAWARTAEEQHRTRTPVPPRRGGIFDRNGIPLALTHETFRVSVAPPELRDPAATARLLRESLALTEAQARAATDRSQRWNVLPGRFTTEQRAQLTGHRGIHLERVLERYYPQGEVGREVLGAVSGDGRPLGGVEAFLDEWLRGEPGYSVLRRDARGNAHAALSLPVQRPRDGAGVVLTIDFDLQEIADAALREAIRTTGAAGGDLLIAEPRTGELLAAVSLRNGRPRGLFAITEPYEPGSTIKPFLAAALLAEGRVALEDSIYGEGGEWRPEGRRNPIRDVRRHEWLTLAEALQVSSNIALAKVAELLAPGEHYRYMRDFGFGTPTGVDHPGESSGRLRAPAQWTQVSQASLAMGYELSVTPLQLLMAYGALANGGVLMEPQLVREVRGATGETHQRAAPRPLRRVVSPEVAAAITAVLAAAVEEGSATRASLATFEVAGKTGTARRTSGTTYRQGSYTSTFAGYFPARDPQLVLLVKLDEPQGAFFGGLTAAPVTRETLQAILATRGASLDGAALLASRRTEGPGLVLPAHRDRAGAPEAPFVFVLGEGPLTAQAGEAARPREVPAVEGLPLRDAVRRLHARGLHVRVEGSGRVVRSAPAAGTRLAPGDTVSLVARRGA